MLQPNFTPFPVLETERLILRKTTEEDAPDLYRLRSNEEVMRYIDRPRPKSIDDILELIGKIQHNIETNNGIEWSIIHKAQQCYVGTVSFHYLMKEHYRAEIGYMMDIPFYGKGIMSEAVQAVLHYGFHTMGLHSVEAHVIAGNTASETLLTRNGFVKEAHFRENYFWNGRFLDSLIYSRLTPLRG